MFGLDCYPSYVLSLFVSTRLSTVLLKPVPVCIPDVLRNVLSRLGCIVSLAVPVLADNVLRWVGGINVLDDDVNNIFPHQFLVFSRGYADFACSS